MTAHSALADAFEVLPAQRNPHVEAARRHVDWWVVEHGLIGRRAARERFSRADFGTFAALTYPTAGKVELCLVADWFAWLFLLDDQLDDGLLGKDPDRAVALMTAICEVLEGPLDKTQVAAGAPTIVTSLADLWRRTSPCTSHTWRRRFLEHMVAGGLAAGWEADNRARGIIPDEAAYVERRRHTGAIYVCMDLIEVTEHIDVPAAVYQSDPFADALRAACDVVCWTNDLYSLDKETSLGEYHNLVAITQHARGLSQVDAVALVARRIVERLEEFLSHRPGAGVPQDTEVLTYLAGMRAWMRGNLDWSANTRRYRDALRHNGEPVNYLENALVEPAGRGQ